MNINDIFKGDKKEINLCLKPAIATEEFDDIPLQEVQLSYSQDVYWLISGEKRIEVTGNSKLDTSELDASISVNTIILLVASRQKKVNLKVLPLVDIITVTEEVEIGLTDLIIGDIDKRYSKELRGSSKTKWLSEQFILESDDKKSLFVNKSADEDAFSVFGRQLVIDVIRNADAQYEITRIRKGNRKPPALYRLEADVRFKDISDAGKIREETELELGKLDSSQRYIKTWEKYQEMEMAKSVEEAKERGLLKIVSIQRFGKNRFYLVYEEDENTKEFLKMASGDRITLSETPEIPDYEKKDSRQTLGFELINKLSGKLLVECDRPVDYNKNQFYYASLSLVGSVIMNKRRTDALQSIRDNTTPMPVLAAVLEGVDYNSIKRRPLKALTSKVKAEFGVYGPNDMQESALDAALNTPDITIIQGPPGTGKTMVISALATRLTEEYKDAGKTPEMSILLTAFQHDAVENMAARTEVLGLPVIKFSKKQSQSIDAIDVWVNKQVEKTEAKQLELEPNDVECLYEDVNRSFLDYIRTINQEKAIRELLQIRKENIHCLPEDISLEIKKLSQNKVSEDTESVERVIDLLSDVRTDKVSYADDGEYNLRYFNKVLSKSQDDVPRYDADIVIQLKDACATEILDDIDFDKVSELKIELLDQFKSTIATKDVKLSNVRIETIYRQIINYLSEEIKSSGSIYTVLSEFQNDLTSNNERVKDTIKNYVTLAAATVQGSKAKEMMSIKPDPFDTVIVDEAARANPLDLLIPLTSAKRRIILVGDHRQLPHIVDEAIQKELGEDENAADNLSKYLKDSLFERFFETLKKLNAKDGIKRVVTLDTQYRMHPVIGDFISRTYYERYGDPKIKSGTSAEHLKHNISEYKGKVAVSVNIPNVKGEEKKRNGSTYRDVEAKDAVDRAHAILDSDPSISVGIIAFYRAQVEELSRQAAKQGLMESGDNDGYFVSKAYQKTPKGEERFRIGSVDAFQGKEFDVVILSLVRSANQNTANFKNISGTYGFLTSYQRLNVAMSRAKKLLIAVGDEAMFRRAESEEHTYGLYAFYNELIDSEYGLSI